MAYVTSWTQSEANVTFFEKQRKKSSKNAIWIEAKPAAGVKSENK